jgi:alpha-N-acetylglucosaminidase
MAKACGTTAGEKALYERNARNLITLWGGKNARLHEYSCRQWSGMLNGFYKPRWEAFFKYVQQSMQEKKPVDAKAFEEQMKDWEWNWVNAHEAYADMPKGDAVAIALQLHGKYSAAINDKYGLK